MANHVEKLQRLRTKVISKLMLFLKLTSGPFLQGKFVFQFAEFLVFRTYIILPNCECGCLLNKQVLCCYQRWAEWSRRFGRLNALTSKRWCFILPVSQSSAEHSALVCINCVTKLSLNEKGISVCPNQKQFQILFGESVWSIYELTICSVLHVSW